jgi:polysaccharide chain length determinant protein (PEP-CTERM system associated)
MNMNTDFEASGPSRELAEYLEIPLRYPYHVILPFVAIFAVAILALAVMPRKYQSSTLIMVESDRASAAMKSDQLGERLGTIKQEIESRTRLEQVLSELKPYAAYGELPLYWQVDEMRRATHIRVQGNDAFSIEYVHRNPEMAMKVTNRLASLFIENTGKLREAAVVEARGFTESSLAESKKMLDQSQLAVRQFKEKYMGALPEQLATNLATLSRLQMEKQTLEGSLQAAESRRELTLNAMMNQGFSSSKTGDSAKQLLELKQNLAALRQRYTEYHPDIQALVARIQAIESSTTDEGKARREAAANASATGTASAGDGSARQDKVVPNLDLSDPAAYTLYTNLEKVNQEIQSLSLAKRDLDARIALLQSRVETTPRIEAELYALEKDYSLSRENYDLMLRKDLQAEMAERLEAHWQADLFRVLDPAHLPERPVSPNGFLFVMAGLFFGAIAGLITAAIADYLDQSVKNVRQLESLVPIPVLATIPQVKRMRKKAKIYA